MSVAKVSKPDVDSVVVVLVLTAVLLTGFVLGGVTTWGAVQLGAVDLPPLPVFVHSEPDWSALKSSEAVKPHTIGLFEYLR